MNRNLDRAALGGLIVWSASLVLVVYGRALTLPLFFDDLIQIPFANETAMIDIWRSSGGYPYYRPLSVTLWRLPFLLSNQIAPGALHAINLLVHLANGVLVGLLANRINRVSPNQHALSSWHPFVATTAYMLFPLSYQAVPWVGALPHLLVTTSMLLALLTYSLFRENGSRIYQFISLAATGGAIFAHENGVMVLPVLFAYELILANGRGRLLLSWLFPSTLGFTVWLLVPKARSGGFEFQNVETIWQNGSYFWQSLSYPVSWMGGWMRDNWGVNDLLTVWILGVLYLFLIGWLFVARRFEKADQMWRVPLFACAWFVLSSVPAVILLPFAYTISAPRLLVLPAVGASLLLSWIIGVWGSVPSRLVRLGAVLLLGIVWGQNYLFIDRHIDQHAALGRVWWQAIAAVDHEPDANHTILINFPITVTERSTTYALGHEGTVFLVNYIPAQQIFTAHTGRQHNVSFRRQDDIRPQLSYIVGVHGDGRDWSELLDASVPGKSWITHLSEDEMRFSAAGAWAPAIEGPRQADFPELNITLTDVRWEVNGAEQLTVELHWVSTAPVPAAYTVFVHGLNKEGMLVAQADGTAWENSLPPDRWPLNQTIRDVRHFVGDDLETITQLNIGLYHQLTGERTPVLTSLGEPDDRAIQIIRP